MSLKLVVKRNQSEQPAEPGHTCLVFPLHRRERKTADSAPEKAWKDKRRPKAGTSGTKRGPLITKVKIAQKQLGISDPDYRLLLQMNFGASV